MKKKIKDLKTKGNGQNKGSKIMTTEIIQSNLEEAKKCVEVLLRKCELGTIGNQGLTRQTFKIAINRLRAAENVYRNMPKKNMGEVDAMCEGLDIIEGKGE